jgi:hypothetical protein
LLPVEEVDNVSRYSSEPVFFMGLFVIDQPFDRLVDKRSGTRKELLTDTAWELLEKQWGGGRWLDSHLRSAKSLKIKIVGRVSFSVRYLEGREMTSFTRKLVLNLRAADDKYAPNGLKLVSQYMFGDRMQYVLWPILIST